MDPKKSRVYVEGLNIVKRHQRPQQVPGAQRAETVGGVIEKEGPIHISNVMLIDPKDKKPTRVGVTREGGQRKRVTRAVETRSSTERHGPPQRAIQRGDPPAAHRALRLLERHAGARASRRSR